MSNLLDETLVTIFVRPSDGRFGIRELPRQESSSITVRRTFREYEQAEQYIDENYSNVLAMQLGDFDAEVDCRANRRVRVSRGEWVNFQAAVDQVRGYKGRLIVPYKNFQNEFMFLVLDEPSAEGCVGGNWYPAIVTDEYVELFTTLPLALSFIDTL